MSDDNRLPPGPSSYDDRQVTRRDLDDLRRRHLREIDDLKRKTRDLGDDASRQRRAVADLGRDAAEPGPAPPPGPGSGSGSGSGAGSSAGVDWQAADDKVLAAAIPVVGLLLIPLAIGHVTAKLTSGEWPSYAPADAPGILGRIAAHPGDPGAAWQPVNTGGDVPGPWVFWPAFALTLALIGAVALAVVTSMRKPAAGKRDEGWATRAQARSLRVRRKGPHRVVLGTVGADRLAVEHHHSLLVVGPAYSGKTSGVTIPALLEWPGPAVVCSTKGELLDQTIGWRSHEGEVHVYDPAATTGYPRSGWSPLAGCTTWQGAIRVARDLTVAARASLVPGVGRDDAAHAADDALWGGSMSMTLAPYLYAAVVAGQPMGTVIDWIAREDRDEVLDALRSVGGPAARTHAASFARPDPDRSAFLRHMYRALGVYDDPVVAASMDRHEIVPDELLDGGRHTLYLTAPEHDQARFRLLNATLLRQVLAAAFDRSSARAAALDPPLLVVLDQVVGIASVDDLAAVAGSGAARGIQVVSVFTDLRQLDPDGQGAWNLLRSHPARLLLPRGPAGAAEGPEYQLLPLSEHGLADGEAALLYGNRPPVRLRLRHWFGVKELRRRAEMPRDAWDPTDHGRDAPHYVTGDQANVWLRRGSAGVGAPAAAPPDAESREFTSIFGSLHEDDTAPINVTPLFDPRGDNPFRR